MATNKDYRKFAVKYNKEFKIAGVHKMKKNDLINAIEERLSKSRKEIRDEYKQLKNIVTVKKTPVKTPVKKPVEKTPVEKTPVKKELIYNTKTLRQMLPILIDAPIASDVRKYTKSEIDIAYTKVDSILKGYELREWKEKYNDKYAVQIKTIKTPKQKFKIDQSKQPKNTKKIKPINDIAKPIIKAFSEPQSKEKSTFNKNDIVTNNTGELIYNSEKVLITLKQINIGTFEIVSFKSDSTIRGLARLKLCQFLQYINNKSPRKNNIKLILKAMNYTDRFKSLNDLVNIYKKMSFKFGKIKNDDIQAEGETTITEFLKFCDNFKKEPIKKVNL